MNVSKGTVVPTTRTHKHTNTQTQQQDTNNISHKEAGKYYLTARPS